MTYKPLSILVVDDKLEYRQAAEEQLGGSGHTLDIADSFNTAMEALLVKPLIRKGIPESFLGDIFLSAKSRTVSAEDKSPPYDVVLTDLLLPASKTMMSPEARSTFCTTKTEMPYGLVIATLALQLGVPYVAINSYGNHHDHPMSYALELL